VSLRHKDLAGARAYLETLLHQQPGHPYLHYALALCDEAEKKYPAALDHLQEALSRSPRLAEPFLEIAKIYQLRGQESAGVASFRHYIQTRPQHAHGYVGLARSYELGAGSHPSLRSQALDTIHTALQIDPKNLAAYRIQSRLYFQMGNDPAF